MGVDRLFQRYEAMQRYVGWSEDDALRVVFSAGYLEKHLPALVDDFYAEISRHEATRNVITGGTEQVERLRTSLFKWISDLLGGVYDRNYAERRWRVGLRHVEIGLDQIFTNAALSRLRSRMIRALRQEWCSDGDELDRVALSLNTLFDLEQAIIEDAYNTHFLVERQNEERLAMLSLINGSMIAIVRSDGDLAYFSPQAERLSGYTSAEVLGRPFQQLLVADQPDALLEKWCRALVGQPTTGWELSIRCRDGNEICMIWQTRWLEEYGQEPGILLVGVDITPLKKEQQRQLQSSRLASIGQMVTILTHESANALQCIQACLDMLAVIDKNKSQSLELIETMRNAQERLVRLYDDVRNYAAPIVLDPSECNLRDLVQSVWLGLGRAVVEKDASIKFAYSEGSLICKLDPFRFEQVFRNILENSLAAGNAPVEVLFQFGSAEIEGQSAVRIVMSDNGPGLTNDQRQHLFDPFYTTKTKGTGLGMSIVRRIVESHQGRISTLHSPTSGAWLEIVLPRESQGDQFKE